MRIVSLNALSAGISRLRTKGGADPQTLYDLANGFVDLAGRCVIRPGTTDGVNLPAGQTKGLAVINGGFVVFSHLNVAQADLPDNYTCERLVHPTDTSLGLVDIHFAAPFLGFLYVVAEFENGDVFHYWLQQPDTWLANHDYQLGELVEPTVPNGFVYKANRLGDPGIVWAPNVARTVGDVIEPTTPNGFKYECIDTLGSNPRSGETEPAWPTEDGATIFEDTDVAAPTAPTTAPTSADTALPDEVIDRYGDGLNSGYRNLTTRIQE